MSKEYLESVAARCSSAAQDVGISLDQLLNIIQTLYKYAPMHERTMGNLLKELFTNLSRPNL